MYMVQDRSYVLYKYKKRNACFRSLVSDSRVQSESKRAFNVAPRLCDVGLIYVAELLRDVCGEFAQRVIERFVGSRESVESVVYLR